MNVQNMKNSRGNKIANQFEIYDENGRWFQSYSSMIVFVPYECDEKIQLDINHWDYSRTTGKYRNLFLNETKKETEAKIKSGEYLLVDFNMKG